MTRPIAVLILCFATAGAAGGRPAIASPLPVTAPGPDLTLLEQETGAQPPATGPGRVVVTIAVEGLRIPAVRVELRNFDGNIVVGQTISDTVGQVTFPDIPAGRYVVRAVREGFADAESVPFTVRGGATEQVLVEMRLTFVRESVDVVVPANSPTESLQPVAVSDVLSGTKMDIQPLAGDDFQSLLTLLPSIIRGPEGRLRIKGGAATTGALQVSSASLNDPSTGDFDPRAAERRRRVRRGALESVRRRVRALLDERHPGAHQARDQRMGVQARQPRPGLRQGVRLRQQVRAAALDLRPAQARQAPARPVHAVPLRAHESQKPAGRAPARSRQLRLVHASRRGVVLTSRPHRWRHLFPAQDHQRHAVDVPASGNHAQVQPGGLLDRPRRSAHPFGARRARVDVCRPLLRGRSEVPGHRAHGLRPARPERQLLQRPAARRPQRAAHRSPHDLEGSVGRRSRVQNRPGPPAIELRG